MPSLLDGVHPDWVTALAPVHGQLKLLEEFLNDEWRNKRRFLPEKNNIMRAFTKPLDHTKVLIVGQDPYPTPGHAVGLSFSVTKETALPRSLTNIFTELLNDLGCTKPSSGDLTPWFNEGVMLLNRVLTVSAGLAGSHQGKGWERVTECAIDVLAQRPSPLVAILWGRQAQSLLPRLQGKPAIQSVHPSPLSAANGFFGSKPFSAANAALVQQGGQPVNWCLP